MTSMRHRFPFPWQGLYSALSAPKDQLHHMNQWLERIRRCGHGRGQHLSWDDLIQCLITEEPKISNKSRDHNGNHLQFIPLFNHFTAVTQHHLLAFLFCHREKIPKVTLESLIKVVSEHNQKQESSTENGNTSSPGDLSSSTKFPNSDDTTWIEYWIGKFQNEITGRNMQTSSSALRQGSLDLNVGYQANELKDKILRRLRGEEAKDQSNPWSGSLWKDVGDKNNEDLVEHTSKVNSGHNMTGDISLSQSFYSGRKRGHEELEDNDLDSFMFTQVAQEPSGKTIRLDLTDSDNDELSESRLGENVGEESMGSISRMKDAWHRTPAVKVSRDDLDKLTQFSVDELGLVADYLDFGGLPEVNLVIVAEQISSLKEKLSLSQAAFLTKACLLKRLLRLESAASRSLHQACVSLSEAFSSEVIQSVFVPILLDTLLGVHQSDFIVKITKEAFTAENRKKMLRCFLDKSCQLSSHTLPVVQTVMDLKTPLDTDTVSLLVKAVSKSSQNLQDNLKFGKVILGLVKGYDRQLTTLNVSSMMQTAEDHKTFLKKSIVAALKKIQTN